MITTEAIERAGQVLARAAASPAKVILFGSHARGEAGPMSDLDFLVIEQAVESRIREAGRLRRALPRLGVPVDVIVVSEADAKQWAPVRGTMVNRAFREGRVLVEP